MSNTSPHPASAGHVETIETPPRKPWGIVAKLGPGLVIAGAIVGSGELIATTATGAAAGFWLLWLIIVGCVIKVFVQVEFGRFAITQGVKTMAGLNEVPGPRIAGRGNWLVWYWVAMFIASMGQLGGIVGGVGQSLAISIPLTESGRLYNQQNDLETKFAVAAAELKLAQQRRQTSNAAATRRILELNSFLETSAREIVRTRLSVARNQLTQLENAVAANRHSANSRLLSQLEKARRQQAEVERQLAALRDAPLAQSAEVFKNELGQFGRHTSFDDRYWAAIIAAFTSILLVMGRYGLIQTISTVMVAGFTFVTIFNLVALQQQPAWAISGNELMQGLSFRLPPTEIAADGSVERSTIQALFFALSTFGIIGVGATELIAYPYWCLEKGYGRFTGPRDSSPAWAERARGWLRVMRWDCWCSMVVYTFATIAFYLLGAAILGRVHLVPQGTELIRTLSVMYEPVFGTATQWLFLFGAFAVLYSTFFIANAGSARMLADVLQVLHFLPKGETTNVRIVRWLSGIFPIICLFIYVALPSPKELVIFSGLMQAMMLPMLAGAALYFRYYRSDARVTPGRLWDFFLWISAGGLLITGVSAAVLTVISYFGK